MSTLAFTFLMQSRSSVHIPVIVAIMADSSGLAAGFIARSRPRATVSGAGGGGGGGRMRVHVGSCHQGMGFRPRQEGGGLVPLDWGCLRSEWGSGG